MALRPINLPADLDIIAEITPPSFNYPENPEWSVQTDEAEGIVETTRALKRMWPLIRLAMLLSPPLRDVLLGYIWEEDGRAVATIMTQRRGTTDKWMISNVGVLPEYRRRGIARKLMDGAVQLIRERGGKAAILDVIDGNTPAISLYQALGFEHYSGSVEFQLTPAALPAAPSMPAGFRLETMGQFDWQPRYEMEKRIAPASLQIFEPVEIGRYRPPVVMRALAPLITAAQKIRQQDYAIHTESGMLVARGGYAVQTGSKGISSLNMRADSTYPAVASVLALHLLHQAAALAPGKRIECSLPHWQSAAIEAIEQAGFQRRMSYLRMGLSL